MFVEETVTASGSPPHPLHCHPKAHPLFPTRTHAGTHTHAHACMHTHTRVHTHTITRACACTHICVHTHTHHQTAHTRAHVHTHILFKKFNKNNNTPRKRLRTTACLDLFIFTAQVQPTCSRLLDLCLSSKEYLCCANKPKSSFRWSFGPTSCLSHDV